MAKEPVDRVYEEWLITRVYCGDKAAFDQLARRWQPRLMRTARRILGESQMAPDVVQECWLAICRGVYRLKDPAKFPVWAYRILHNKCMDRIKKQIRTRETISGEPVDADLARPANAENIVAIHQAFARLGPTHRMAAVLFYSEGLTLAEIASVTNVPLGTAKSRLFKARQELKSFLKGDDDD